MGMSSPQSHAYTEPLNFKVTGRTKERLEDQAFRLDLTQTSTARLALAIGLEALERLQADPTTVDLTKPGT